MGSCFGRCITAKNNTRSPRSQRSMYFREADNVEFDFLVDDETSTRESRPRQGISYLLSFKRRKRPPRGVTLELTDDSWPRRESNPRLPGLSATQFQPLDARSLLARGLLREMASRTSTPVSSLDLEWENEGGLPLQPLHYSNVTEDEACESATTTGRNGATSRAWSRMSSPDSLEWDPVEAPLDSGLDAETELLLTEIERLTSRALRETGDWTS